jgi:hypothetical protein
LIFLLFPTMTWHCFFICSDVCCTDAFNHGFSEFCKGLKNSGEICSTTRDEECAKDKCGKKNYWDSTCENTIIISWHSWMKVPLSTFDIFLPLYIRCVLCPNFCTSRMDNGSLRSPNCRNSMWNNRWSWMCWHYGLRPRWEGWEVHLLQ